MSTPVVFILFPLIISILLFIFQDKKRTAIATSIFICVLLGLFAYFQEFGQVWKIGPVSIEIKTTLPLLGRSFILTNSDRFFLSFVYLSSALWFGAAHISGISERFIPIGLAIVSLLTAALAVEPFIYSSIFVETAVLVSIPLMIKPGKPAGKGVLRFVIFQSLAMPLILFGGWLLSGIQASPSDTSRLLQAALILGIGFSFWLAIFPFQSWVPQLTTDIHPLFAGFILELFPIVTLLIMVDFISGLVWLRESAYLGPTLRLVGTIMVVLTGLWAVFEKDIRRILGYVVLFASGFSLVLIGLQSDISIKTLYISFIPRCVALAVMALSLSIIMQFEKNPTTENVKGMIRKLPFASSAFLVSLLSIAGFPIFSGFSTILAGIEQTSQIDNKVTIWLIIGIALFLFAAIRYLSIFADPQSDKWSVNETLSQIVYLTTGLIILLAFGVVPNLFGTSISSILINLPILR